MHLNRMHFQKFLMVYYEVLIKKQFTIQVFKSLMNNGDNERNYTQR